MRKEYIILSAFLFSILLITSLSFAEEITITTYYPSPYGIYEELTTTGNTYLATSSGGNVGIGTTAPNEKLHIYRSSSSAGSTALRLEYYCTQINGCATSSRWVFQATSSGGQLHILNPTTPRLTIDSAGNVGIGTTSPTAKLELGAGNWLMLNAPSAGTVGINFYETGAKAATNVQYGGKIFYDEPSDTFRIVTRENSVDMLGIAIARATGNVGIGTTNPAGRLEINMGNNNNYLRVNNDNNIGIELRSGTSAGTPFIDFSNDATIDYDMRLILLGDNRLDVSGGDLTISAGNVGIGTTNPGARLDVSGTVRATEYRSSSGNVIIRLGL